MAVTILNNDFVLDAFGLPATLSCPIEVNQTSDPGITGFTVTYYENDNVTPLISNFPFTATVVQISSQQYRIDVTNYSATAIFGFKYRLTLTSSTGSTVDVYIVIGYSTNLVPTLWSNSPQTTDPLENFGEHLALTTPNANLVFRALFNATINAYEQIKNYIKYYSFKHKYLNDIIDLSIHGITPIASDTVVTYDANNNIETITTTYSGRIVKITNTYASSTITRLRKRNGSYTDLDSNTISLLDTFTVDIINGSSQLLYRLATVTINRSTGVYTNHLLSDYVESAGDTDPSNILSDYKYYRTSLMTGWTVE